MAYEKPYGRRTTLNDMLRYGGMNAAYGEQSAGYAARGAQYGVRGGDGAAAEDYTALFFKAAGLAYGAVRGMQDSQYGRIMGGNAGVQRGNPYGNMRRDAQYDGGCQFPDCPHHGNGQYGSQYGGLERSALGKHNDRGKAEYRGARN